ncbi:putative ribonuclease H-like domain-containing protein [Tanacetum coccineum]
MNVSPIPTTRIHKDHPKDQIIGDINSATQTRRMTKITEEHAMAMQDELLQFRLQKVWRLVNLPKGKHAIGTKWVYINKKDKRGIVVRNKARLVAQGYIQEKGIDYDEVFAPVDRIEAIRLFLAYASFMGFIVYQMDVKSAFLYGTIEEDVYVCQPPGFEDPQFPDKVYKVEKALYGLHQAPRAWYETLSTYLLKNRFRRGTIDKTLFIKKDKGDIMLVQVYVDDIIFGSTKKSLCVEFEQMMHKRFQMSSMGELTFFLRLQVKKKDNGIFISQDKYVADILNKFDFVTMKTASTLIETNKALLKDEEAEDVDVHLYRSMIRSLMYLTASRPDIMFAVCACARDSPFDLEAFSDSDYAGASLDRKSTTKLLSILSIWYCIEGRLMMSICSQEWMEGHVGDEAVHKELGDRMERDATTASSLESEQDNGNINRTQSMVYSELFKWSKSCSVSTVFCIEQNEEFVFLTSSCEYDTLSFDFRLELVLIGLTYYEAFCIDVDHQKEKSSGSTNFHSDHSLLDYETFFFDHQKENSSGSTTSYPDPSDLEYELFYFNADLKEFEDLLYYNPLIDPPPISEKSDSHHEEFADELAHIISPLEYDYFYFDIEADLGELTRLLRENISISFPSGNKDKIFDLGILIINGAHSKKSLILPLNDSSPILLASDLLFLLDPSEMEALLLFPSGNKDKVFNPGILIIKEVQSFTIKSPHLFKDNFKIDKRHILSEISSKTESSVSFQPTDNGIRGESS